MKITIVLLAALILSGCTIVNLAPPEPDDGLLQQTLEKYAGPVKRETN